MQGKLQLSLYLFLSFFIITLTSDISFSEINAKQSEKNSPEEGGGITERIKKDDKLRLDLEKLLKIILKDNLDVKKALLDYKTSTIELKNYKSRFDYNLFLKPDYSSIENSSENPASMFQGTGTRLFNVDGGISRKFRTGTNVKLGVNGMYQDVDTPVDYFNTGGKGYQSGFVVSVSQEILKNMFGISDRLNEKIIDNSGEIKKRVVKMYLAGLLVEALTGYWNVLVAEDNLETVKISLDSTINIRNLVKRKKTLGLSEKEELLDWNSKALQSKNLFAMARKNLYDAKRAVLRTLNLDENTDFYIVKILKTTPPEVAVELALKDAFTKRVDLANQRTLIRNSEFNCKIASHNLEPSLKLNISAGSIGYSRDAYHKTFNDINKQWSAGFELTYPLENNKAETGMRQAMLDYKKNNIELQRLEKEIKDEIDSIVKHCDVMYSVYTENKKSKDYSKSYYNQVFKKFKRGRYDAVRLKLALDNYIKTRQMELKSLVDYNITLLRRDLARNVIFENFAIDIDSILNRLE